MCESVEARRLVVRTSTTNAAGEAVRTSIHSVSLWKEQVLPGGQILPGAAAVGPMLVTPGGKATIASSGMPWEGGFYGIKESLTFMTGIQNVPFDRLIGARQMSAQGWRQYAAGFVSGDSGDDGALLILGTRVDAYGAWRGRLDLRGFRTSQDGAGIVFTDMVRTWSLPGAPVGAVLIPQSQFVAVLCIDAFGINPILHVRDTKTGEPVIESLKIVAKDEFGAEPAGISISPDGKLLYVLTSGYSLSRKGGGVSWLHVLDTSDFKRMHGALLVPGVAKGARSHGMARSPLIPTHRGVWITTLDPGTGFARAVRVAVNQNGLVEEVNQPFQGVTGALLLSPAFRLYDTGRPVPVAVAVEDRLEVWLEGKPSALPYKYPSRIRTIEWTSKGLFIGEGNRIHLVDTSNCAPLKSVALQSGLVTDFVLLSPGGFQMRDPDFDGVDTLLEEKRGTDPEKPDTDGDGVHDGIDPEPLLTSPILDLPPVVTFRAEASGYQKRVVPLSPDGKGPANWNVYYDSKAMPWLRVEPRQGRSPENDSFMISVIRPSLSTVTDALSGIVTVTATGTHEDVAAANSPFLMEVIVLPYEAMYSEPGGSRRMHFPRRILWILDRANPEGTMFDAGLDNPNELDKSFDVLAAPPHYFVHNESEGTLQLQLEHYSVVVVDAKSASEGGVLRQSLREYVTNGGGLLFIGGYLGADPQRDKSDNALGPVSLSRWLSPVGVTLNVNMLVEGSFSTNKTHPLSRNWKSFRIENGCAVSVNNRSALLVRGKTGEDSCVFSAHSYGYGRIAVLASASPLENTQNSSARVKFVAGLFEWLSQAGGETNDLDADRLPDYLEDVNGNGVTDPGETDMRLADTDFDGLPDGLEDFDRDGIVDPWETSPLNPDSDGDGTPDGADSTPYASLDAPHVEGVSPPSGPLEGGGSVLVTGRNFVPGNIVKFGNAVSPRVRVISTDSMIVETPPGPPEGVGDVAVAVSIPEGELEGLLPTGFRYEARTKVGLSVQALVTAQDQYRGELTIHLDCPGDASVGNITLRLDPAPAQRIRWAEVSQGATAEFSGRNVAGRPDPVGRLWIDVSKRRRNPAGGEIATVAWESDEPLTAIGPITISIGKYHVRALNEEPLETTATGCVVRPARRVRGLR